MRLPSLLSSPAARVVFCAAVAMAVVLFSASFRFPPACRCCPSYPLSHLSQPLAVASWVLCHTWKSHANVSDHAYSQTEHTAAPPTTSAPAMAARPAGTPGCLVATAASTTQHHSNATCRKQDCRHFDPSRQRHQALELHAPPPVPRGPGAARGDAGGAAMLTLPGPVRRRSLRPSSSTVTAGSRQAGAEGGGG